MNKRRTRTNSKGVFERLCTGAIIGGRGINGDRLSKEHYTLHENFAVDNANEIDKLQAWCKECMNVYAVEFKKRTGDNYTFKANSQPEDE